MSYLVIARKWRPQTFDEIVGQEHVSQTLQNAIRSNRVAHAFLFTGVRGVGKTTAARILAKALNCEKGPTPTPCNVCANCREITAGNAVDVLEIDGASNTGVDDVREIIENVRYQPAKSRFKIYIIDEVHMLSTSAFNALLKTLEEPPAHVKFIFATTDPHKVPHTIHSRCQRYDFKRISYRAVADRLAHIAKSEGIEVSDRALFLIAREGEGSMRDAQSLFDQVIAFAGKTIRDEDVVAALGLADRRLLYAVGEAIVERNPTRAVELLHELHQYGYDLRRVTRELLEHFRNLSIARLVPGEGLLDELPAEDRAEVDKQAKGMSSEDLDRAFRLLVAAENEVARVPYPKLVLEMTLIKLATLAPVLPLDQLVDRLEDIERRLAAGGGGLPSRPPESRPPLPTAAARPPAPVSVPAGAPTPSPSRAPAARPAPAPAVVPVSSSEAGWADFLTFVGREKIMLLPYLQATQSSHLQGGELVLQVAKGHLYDYLADRSHTRIVEELAERFYGRAVRVSVRAAEADAETAATADPASPAALHKSAMGHPAVQAAVEILGGEVHEVKPRPRRGRTE
ncbi:MAG TPA: DNA polymerase III subunit gamma/tau [Candidatus Acidoferrales bacterium]|nr:DNA polymerase III subunit gamma/tau [Candidatus Acidoferrales bacterium]